MAINHTPQTPPAFAATLGYISTYTFSAVPIGSPSSDRLVVVSFANGGVTGILTSIYLMTTSILGVSLNRAVANLPGNAGADTEIWIGNVPDAITTADIVVNAEASALQELGLVVDVITGADAIPYSSAVGSPAGTYTAGGAANVTTSPLTLPSGGLGIAAVGSVNTDSAVNLTWNFGTVERDLHQTSTPYDILQTATTSSTGSPSVTADASWYPTLAAVGLAPYSSTFSGYNLIPPMTAATTSGVTMSGGPTAGSSDAWLAADRSLNPMTYWTSGTNSFNQSTGAVVNGTGEYLIVDFGSGTSNDIRQYSIQTTDTEAYSPRSWTLEGSNSGAFAGEQTTIDTQTAVANWMPLEKRTYKLGSASAGYRYFRLNVTLNQLGRAIHISEFELDGDPGAVAPTALTATDLAATAAAFGTPSLAAFTGIWVNTWVLDAGLSGLAANCNSIYICSQQPVDFTGATATYALGHYTFGVGSVFGSPTAGSPNGRVVTSNPVTSGSITANGTAAWWAAVDTVNSRLLATGPVSGAGGVTSGSLFTLSPITVHLPSQ